MSYVSKYFYCCIQSEGLLYDAERELLAIAKLLVNEVTFYYSYISRTQIRIQNLLQKSYFPRPNILKCGQKIKSNMAVAAV